MSEQEPRRRGKSSVSPPSTARVGRDLERQRPGPSHSGNSVSQGRLRPEVYYNKPREDPVMKSSNVFAYFVLPALVAITAMKLGIVPNGPRESVVEASSEMPEMTLRPAEAEEKQNDGPDNSTAKKAESKLVVGNAIRSEGGLVRFPLHFAAAAGENVGTIRVQVAIPDGSWTFRRVELASGLRLKLSAKVRKRDQKRPGEGQVPQALLELNFSGGSHAIQDGLIGFLQFLLPGPETPIPDSLDVKVLSTSPPATQQLTTTPLENPRTLPPGPAANPAVSCFFFTH